MGIIGNIVVTFPSDNSNGVHIEVAGASSAERDHLDAVDAYSVDSHDRTENEDHISGHPLNPQNMPVVVESVADNEVSHELSRI